MKITNAKEGVYTSPVISPLATVPDLRGEVLQKAMIWTSSDAVTQNQADFTAFRQKFSFYDSSFTAILTLFADARYMLWINGQYVLRGPARFEPAGPEYDVMQISRFLRKGENSIVVLVMGNASNGKMRRHTPGLNLHLELNGKTALATDDSWKWSKQIRYLSPNINWGNVMDNVDARVEDGDWTQPDYDDANWETAHFIDGLQWGPLSRRRTPLLRERAIEPQFAPDQTWPVTLTASQELSFSTDKLVQAYTILELEADEGTEIWLDYAKIKYIARAGCQIYISSDTHGFFGGSLVVKSGQATILSLCLVERLYPFDVAGSFQSNDAALNRLWAMCARSAQVLSEDAYVDCADRERTEWMDCDPPGFDITRTALSVTDDDGKQIFSDARLLGALLRRTALSVQSEGWVKAHTASDRFDIHAKMEDRACDWVEGARRYYDSTNDANLIREIWPVIVRQMDYFLERRTARGLFLGREWEVWGNPLGYVTCEGAGLNAFVYKALVDAAYLGAKIGEKQQVARLSKAAQKLAKDFNEVLWNEEAGTYYGGYTEDYEKAKAGRRIDVPIQNNRIAPTMMAALFSLDQGIVPPERRARVTQYLFAHRDKAERVMTFYYLFQQQYEADNAVFDREILQTMRTKWATMIQSPWDCSWEDFVGGSKAHIYGMFPGYYLSAYVLGVRQEGPIRDNRILIEPRLGDLTSAEGIVVTPYGPVSVSWKIKDEKLNFRFAIPAGIRARLHIPQNGKNVRLMFNGKFSHAKVHGRYFEMEVGAGFHQGYATFASEDAPKTPSNSETLKPL